MKSKSTIYIYNGNDIKTNLTVFISLTSVIICKTICWNKCCHSNKDL